MLFRFYFFIIIYFILFFNFTILYWFCHISTWIRHRYTRVPHPEPSSLLPPVPSLWMVPVHQPQAFRFSWKKLFPALNLQGLHRTLCFPGSSDGTGSACNARDLGLIPGLGIYPGEGNGNPLHYSCLENSMDSPWGCKESDMTEGLTLSLLSYDIY